MAPAPSNATLLKFETLFSMEPIKCTRLGWDINYNLTKGLQWGMYYKEPKVLWKVSRL